MKFNAMQWTVFTAIGLAGGLAAGVLLGSPLGQLFNAMIVTALVVAVVGAVLGSFQAAGLRPLLAKPWWWIAATILGTGAGLALAVVLVEEIGRAITGAPPRVAHLGTATRALSFVVVGFVTGTVLGLAQWLVLRAEKTVVKNWVIVCGIALGAAFSLASLFVDLAGVQFPTVAGRIIFVVLAGLMFGGLTSLPLRSYAAR